MESYTTRTEKFILFSQEELSTLLRNSKAPAVKAALRNSSTREELEAAITRIAEDTAHDRDEHEIIIALHDIATYFPDGKIGLAIRPGEEIERAPQTVEELNKLRKVDDNSDVAIFNQDGIRKYQLKRYRGEMTTDALFSFLHEKLRSYGYKMGTVNVWVVLQPTPFGAANIDYSVLHKRIAAISNLECGEIYISYNEQNTSMVLQRVYPEVGGKKTPIE